MRPAYAGLTAALTAFCIWGFMPVYFKALGTISPIDIIAHRAFWGVPTLCLLVGLRRKYSVVLSTAKSPRGVRILCSSAFFLAINWFTYVWGVHTKQVLETSLGYFINPLVNVLLGMVFFEERPRRNQWVAIILASFGVAQLVWHHGAIPWIALVLAVSFGLYGTLRKAAKIEGMVGLLVEMSLLWPIALGYFVIKGQVLGRAILPDTSSVVLLLILSGLITAIPLSLFSYGAQRLTLSTVGITQYVAPTIQFVLAVVAFHEPFNGAQLTSFCFIWAGLVVFSAESIWHKK